MKLKIDRNVFAKAFNLVASATASKSPKPVLENVKMTAKGNSVLLQATDLEIGIRTRIEDCEIAQDGDVILPAVKLKQILQVCKDSTLSFSGSGEKLSVKGSDSRYSLMTMPVDEFPDVENFPAEMEKYHEMTASSLAEAIRRTVFAADVTNAKYALGGVMMEMKNDEIHAVATDGRQLAYQSATGESFGEHKSEMTILPTKPLSILSRCLDDSDGQVGINTTAARAIFQTGSIVFYVRLIEGRFPRWRTILPNTDGRPQVDISAGALLAAVRQAAVTTTEKKPGVEFTFAENKLELRGQGDEIGESNVELPIDYSGTNISFKLDPKFVADYLHVLDGKATVRLFIHKDEAILFQTDDGYFYVVMPLS